MPGSPSPITGPDGASPRERIIELLVAALVLALGIYVVLEARGIRVLPVHSRVGPRVIPYIIGAALIVLGVWLALEILTGRSARPTDDAEDADTSLPTDWRCLAYLAGALLLYLLLLERAGFVIASAILFLAAAFGMGSRRVPRDAAIGILLSAAVYLAFTEGLGLRLPAGWLEVLE